MSGIAQLHEVTSAQIPLLEPALTKSFLSAYCQITARSGRCREERMPKAFAAAFAAGAEAHLTGELAVCAGSCGPGNLHLINGLFDCHRSRVPVLAIAAQIPSAEIGTGYFQETHPETLFRNAVTIAS